MFIDYESKSNNRFLLFLLVACILVAYTLGSATGYVSTSSDSENTVLADSTYQTSIFTATNNSSDLNNFLTVVNDFLTVVEVAAVVKQAVVEITTETVTTGGRMGQFIQEGAGSGVVVSADGYIATNYHVVSGAKKITVRLTDGAEYSAQIVGSDSKTDLAVIKIQATGLTAAVIGDSSAMVVGETVVAVGNPLGELGGTVTSGILSALDRAITIDGVAMRLLQTDAAINPGNSGGGLFNLKGELIGIVNAKSSGTGVEGLGFAIPSNTAKHIIDSIIENGYVKGRVDIGLTLIEVNNAQTAMMYRVNKTGLYIYGSTNKDFESGDRIVSIDGSTINSLLDYNNIIDSHKVGDTVKISVSRRGQNLSIKVKLTELQSSTSI